MQAAGLVVTGSNDGILRVWRLADGACLRTLTGHTDGVWDVVDVGGGRVASGGDDCVLRVWDVLSGKQLRQTPTGGDLIICLATLGTRVATGHEGTGLIRLWSLSDGCRAAGVMRGHTDTVWSLAAVGAAARQLASASWDASVRLWDVDGATCTAVLSGHSMHVLCVADLGGGRLLSGSGDRSLRVWDAATGACLAGVEEAHGEDDGMILAACSLPGGAATGSHGDTLQRWRWDEGARALTRDGAPQQLGGEHTWALTAATLPDGLLRLLVGCHNGAVLVLRAAAAGGALTLQAELAGHSLLTRAVVMMAP